MNRNVTLRSLAVMMLVCAGKDGAFHHTKGKWKTAPLAPSRSPGLRSPLFFQRDICDGEATGAALPSASSMD